MSGSDFELNDILNEFQAYDPQQTAARAKPQAPAKPGAAAPAPARRREEPAPKRFQGSAPAFPEKPVEEAAAETAGPSRGRAGVEARPSRPRRTEPAREGEQMLRNLGSGLRQGGSKLVKGAREGWEELSPGLRRGGEKLAGGFRGLRERLSSGEGRPSWLPRLIAAALLILSLLCLSWILHNVHPGSGTVVRGKPKADLSARISAVQTETTDPGNPENPEQNASAPVKKHYKIERDAVAAPAPDPACFGTISIDEPEKVLEIIQQARDMGLLREDETVAFDPSVKFYYDEQIEYYLDETILVICWKELIEGNTCSFAEIKISDPSQLRRKFADDTFASANQYYSTELHKSTNAVLSVNADFYQNRDFGVVVYNSRLYRFPTATYTGNYKKYNCLETCYVNDKGDFLFTELGQTFTQEELERYIAENNILFSMSFGPVLVRDGEVRQCDWYPVGEINKGYSRAGIGQVDELHYLYMSLNHSPEAEARWTVNQFARHFGEKPVINAYCLDGGQTSEIVFRGRPYNHVDYGKERPVSDNIYFATAIGGTEVSG